MRNGLTQKEGTRAGLILPEFVTGFLILIIIFSAFLRPISELTGAMMVVGFIAAILIVIEIVNKRWC